MTTPNFDDRRTIVTSCGVLIDSVVRVLFVHRRDDRDRWPGIWYLPGGEALDDEDVDDALVRELREEVGVDVRRHDFLETLFDEEPISGRRAVHNIYAVLEFEGDPELLAPEEHDQIEWLSLDQLPSRGVPDPLTALLVERMGAPPPVPPAAEIEPPDTSPAVEPLEPEEGWDQISSRYQEYAKIPTDKIHYGAGTPTENELQLVGDPQGRDVIDVGCGGGQNTIAFKRAGAARVVGIDQSTEQLEFARDLAAREGIDVEFLKSAVETLDSVPDASFDAAFSSYCFQFVADIRATFRSIYRVLRPGGRFAFCLDHPAYMMFGTEGFTLTKPYFQRHADFIWPFRQGGLTGMSAVYHTVEDMFAALRQAGFVVESILEPELEEQQIGDWKHDVDRARKIPRTVIFAARKPEDPS